MTPSFRVITICRGEGTIHPCQFYPIFDLLHLNSSSLRKKEAGFRINSSSSREIFNWNVSSGCKRNRVLLLSFLFLPFLFYYIFRFFSSLLRTRKKIIPAIYIYIYIYRMPVTARGSPLYCFRSRSSVLSQPIYGANIKVVIK